MTAAAAVRPRVGALVIGYGAPAVALLVYAVYWSLYLYAPEAYQALLRRLGIGVWPYPFLDLQSVLTAIDCARVGVDVTLPNACMGGGLFQYSPLLLQAAALPLGAGQLRPLGLGLDGLFLLSLFALPRPRRWTEFWLLLLAAVSSCTLLAVERANIDVAIFVLVLSGTHLVLGGPNMRLAGYATLLGAAAIKFYPASELVLAARERPGRFVAITLASLAAAGLLLLAYPAQLQQVAARLPQGNPLFDIFASGNVPFVLGVVADDGEGAGGAVRRVALALLIGVCAARTLWLAPAMLADVRLLARRERLLLVAGAAAIAFCFFAATNAPYRAIFLILALPGLGALDRSARHSGRSRRFGIAAWVVVGLMWSDFIRVESAWLAERLVGPQAGFVVRSIVWLLHELLWWWLTSLLLGAVLCFLWDTPIVRRLRLVPGWRARLRTWLAAGSFGRFLIVGGLNTAVAFGGFPLLYLSIGNRIGYLPILVFCAVFNPLFAFAMHRFVTFQSRGAARAELWRYLLLNGAGFLAGWGFLAVIDGWPRGWFVLGQVGFNVAMTAISFLVVRRFVFGAGAGGGDAGNGAETAGGGARMDGAGRPAARPR